MSVNDDFSYTKSAFDFARTGHILYNGWATAMLGWQVVWGGIFGKLFGYSFTAVRLSTLPVAMASVYLLHQILIRFGANAWNAVIGTLTMALSPLFIPLTTSFMSDVPGVFCILLCLYMCQRALQATSQSSAAGWLCLASAVNVIDGTVRQIVWFGVLVMVPATAWLLRRRYALWGLTALLWVLSAISIELFLRWFKRQPYSVPLKMLEGPIDSAILRHFVIQFSYLFLTLLMFVLPLLISSLPAAAKLPAKYRYTVYAGMAVISTTLLLSASQRPLEHVLGPWIVNIVTKYGVIYFPDIGGAPLVLQRWVRLLVTLLVFISTLGLGAVFVSRPKIRGHFPLPEPALFSSYGAVTLTASFALSYAATLVPRAVYHDMLDRYVLPIFPLLIVVLVLYYQQQVGERLPLACVVLITFFAAFAVAATHDFFSMDRARLAATGEIERTGVPRTLIHGFLEYDAWTQLDTQGHINEKLIEVPAGVYQTPPHRHLPPEECRFWYADDLPAVHPKFLVVRQRQSCLKDTTFLPVVYRTWLPPFRGEVYVQEQQEGYDWIY